MVVVSAWRQAESKGVPQPANHPWALRSELAMINQAGCGGSVIPGRRQRIVHALFDISVIVKGIDGVLEIVGGVLLLVISPAQLDHLARILTQRELSEDPHDRLANYLFHGSAGLSTGAKMFAAMYLLWHGAVKVGLVTALLLKRRWAYPAAIVAFLLFLLYQLFRYSVTAAPELLVLSIVDVVVILLTWLEYRRLRASDGFVQ